MVHHDYGAQRFSKLETINKSNVKNMKLLFAVAIGGTSPTRRWRRRRWSRTGSCMWSMAGARSTRSTFAPARQGRILWKIGSGPGEIRPHPRRGAVAQPRHLDHRQGRRVIATDKDTRQDRLGQEFARSAGGRAVLGAARAQGRHHRRCLRRRPGRARLDRLARSENRRFEMEDLCHPRARRARQRNLEGQEQCLADRRRRVLRHRFLRSANEPDLLGIG